METREQIETLLAPLDLLPLECDGFVQCAAWVLQREQIPHEVWAGTVEFGGKRLPFHTWFRVGEYLVDYRLRMWFGKAAPHGVLSQPVEGVTYRGQQVRFVPDPRIFQILTGLEP